MKPIPVKWVYKIKRTSDGKIDRYKARLVAKGYKQRYGIDFFETYSGTSKPTTLRAMLAMAAVKKLHVRQLDVKTAFLNGVLEEDTGSSSPLATLMATLALPVT